MGINGASFVNGLSQGARFVSTIKGGMRDEEDREYEMKKREREERAQASRDAMLAEQRAVVDDYFKTSRPQQGGGPAQPGEAQSAPQPQRTPAPGSGSYMAQFGTRDVPQQSRAPAGGAAPAPASSGASGGAMAGGVQHFASGVSNAAAAKAEYAASLAEQAGPKDRMRHTNADGGQPARAPDGEPPAPAMPQMQPVQARNDAGGAAVGDAGGGNDIGRRLQMYEQLARIDLKYNPADPSKYMAMQEKISAARKEGMFDAYQYYATTGDLNGSMDIFDGAGGKKIDRKSVKAEEAKDPLLGRPYTRLTGKYTDGSPFVLDPIRLAENMGGAKYFLEQRKAEGEQAIKTRGKLTELEAEQAGRRELEGQKHGYSMAEIAARGLQDRKTVGARGAEDRETAKLKGENKPGGDLKATEGLKVLASRFGGRLEGDMWIPDVKNRDTALRANVLFEERIAAGELPMAAASAAAQQAEREKAMGALPIGQAPGAAAGGKDYSSLWK